MQIHIHFFSAECSDDQRCCDEAEDFASSLFKLEDVIDGTKVVDEIDCYNQVRKQALDYRTMSLKCLLAFFHTCVDYVRYENDGLFTNILFSINVFSSFLTSGKILKLFLF